MDRKWKLLTLDLYRLRLYWSGKYQFHRAVVNGKKLIGCNFSPIEYGGNVRGFLLCGWQHGSCTWRFALSQPMNVLRLTTFHGSIVTRILVIVSKKSSFSWIYFSVRDSSHPTWDREVVEWNIILLHQGFGDAFEHYQGRIVRTGYLPHKIRQQYTVFGLKNVKYSMEYHVRTRAVQEADHCTCIFSNGSYIRVDCEFQAWYSFKERFVFERWRASVHCDTVFQGLIGSAGI